MSQSVKFTELSVKAKTTFDYLKYFCNSFICFIPGDSVIVIIVKKEWRGGYDSIITITVRSWKIIFYQNFDFYPC